MAHFGLAYQLQKELHDDFFAIIDTPSKPKKMFLNQKIVNFQKTWFFHDHIKKSNEKPDLKYLSNFERKYNINLWKLAINERHFYKFNRFYKFSKNEILKFLEQECKLFESVLDEINPDFIVLNEPPFHHQKLLLELCRSRGVKILQLCISRVGASTIIAEDISTFDLPQNLDSIEFDNSKKPKSNEMDYNESNLVWAKDRKFSSLGKLKALIDYILYSDSKNVKSNYTYYGRKKSTIIFDTFLFYIRRQRRYNYLQKNSKKIVNLQIPFIYFPLALDDDAAILNDAPYFTDQIEVVRHVAKSIPVGYQLYVKEHWSTVFRGWKEIKYYQDINELPNVTLIHPSYSSKELTKNCKIVISVRGSSSLEAAFENKPSIVFDKIPHDILPSVYLVNSLTNLPELIKTALDATINPMDVKKYDKWVRERIVDVNWSDLELLRNEKLYSGNILSDVEYPENKVREFFEENETMFKKLSDAHLQKINQMCKN